MISETKVDDLFLDGQFFLDGFGTPFRLNRIRNGGGIMLSIRNDIPAKVVSLDDRPIESFNVVTFSKEKMAIDLFLQHQTYQYRITSRLSFREYRFTII